MLNNIKSNIDIHINEVYNSKKARSFYMALTYNSSWLAILDYKDTNFIKKLTIDEKMELDIARVIIKA